ncbi:Rrf2 family transcriptional regulator [Spectribacter hydrogenoxidans]|uniref:Rrf2 family transcriptional regulator n=1 Tax=Spectribacter hydrogenoxidans TaxID=3075608 RepID=A0ABU3C398_9GAMM|nr:Rrf2 family transcriptional regulator [Salinisphaera sp. W335]MDT0636023.1 Rrf2 family transcriptional regulator [Salinisphaera sp. W335]
MQLTTHTDYSLRLLIYLGIHSGDRPATVQDAANRYGISANHLAKVAQTLVQLGYIHSHRGRGGGLELALPVAEINVGAVVRQTENLQLLECFGPNSTCPIDPACKLKGVLGKAQQAFLEVLDSYRLSDLISNRDRLRKLLDVA